MKWTLLVGFLASFGGFAQAADRKENLWIAEAELMNTDGKFIGKASLTETQGGVVVKVKLSGIAPGEYGIHFHEFGECVPPSFMSAGGHFNPNKKEHGLKNTSGPHAGDLPNLVVTGKEFETEMKTSKISLKEGANSLFKVGGTALVIHAQRDDETSNPAGNSGPRMLCGVIKKISPMDIKNAKTLTAE